jgi:electron transport complex protein RnfB
MILYTTLAIGGIGLICGSALALAARFLAVHEDPRVEELTEILPGVNCGGCGYAGCGDYAKAVVLDGVEITLCAPGGADTLTNMAAFMGVEAESGEKQVAIVLCGGDSDQAPRQFLYNGVADCTAAHAVGGGDKKCRYGCLGYGSCARACPVGAIEITDKNLAVVHPDLCISCSKCVRTCPRQLIKMVPESRHAHVMCSSKDKGPIVKKACKVGCIGCRICTKQVEDEAITMDGFLAIVNYDKPIESATVAPKCPGKCIVDTHPPPAPVEEEKAEAEA